MLIRFSVNNNTKLEFPWAAVSWNQHINLISYVDSPTERRKTERPKTKHRMTERQKTQHQMTEHQMTERRIGHNNE